MHRLATGTPSHGYPRAPCEIPAIKMERTGMPQSRPNSRLAMRMSSMRMRERSQCGQPRASSAAAGTQRRSVSDASHGYKVTLGLYPREVYALRSLVRIPLVLSVPSSPSLPPSPSLLTPHACSSSSAPSMCVYVYYRTPLSPPPLGIWGA